jgi:hypothetical protein
VAREVLWALDAAQAAEPAWRIVLNFLRSFGGPIQTMMRRYRFVEQCLTIGMPEDTRMVEETRKNVKLWNRVDGKEEAAAHAWDETSYRRALEAEEEVSLPSKCISSPASASARHAEGSGTHMWGRCLTVRSKRSRSCNRCCKSAAGDDGMALATSAWGEVQAMNQYLQSRSISYEKFKSASFWLPLERRTSSQRLSTSLMRFPLCPAHSGFALPAPSLPVFSR